VQIFQSFSKTVAVSLLAMCISSCASTSTGQNHRTSSIDYRAIVKSSIKPGLTASRAISTLGLGINSVNLVDAQKKLHVGISLSAPKEVPQTSGFLTRAISAVMGREEDLLKPAVAEIKKSAKEHGVPPTLLAAVIQHESGFNQKAVSGSGAIGLSQIMPKVWSGFCKKISTIPGNVDCGARVLKSYYESSGSWEKALAFYNVGPGNYQRSSRSRAAGSQYAKKVMKNQLRIDQQLAILNLGD
jgi:hypothetical protein